MKNDILPEGVISLVQKEGQGLGHGIIRLEIFLRDGHPRWNVTTSRSIIVDDIIPNGTDVNYLKPFKKGLLLTS